MKKVIKIFLYNFFVLFFIYLFLFSTNKVLAKTYKIENIEISDVYNTSFNKDDIIDRAFIAAYQILLNKITISKDHKIIKEKNLKLIKSFVESFSVVNEKFENNKYHGVFEINFNKSKILSFLREQNIFHARMIKKDVLFIPIYINLNEDSLLLFEENPFYKNWNIKNENQFLINYVLQNEDLDDYKLIKDRVDFIENYDFKEIISKYEINDNYIIFIVFGDKNKFKTFSKFNVNEIASNFKFEFEIFNFNETKEISKMINVMKIKYDDEWKKINLINSSIKLNIQLNVDSKKISLIKRVEKILNEIELIEKYNIDYFDSNITRYTLLTNSTPDKLIKELKRFDLKISNENNVWVISE